MSLALHTGRALATRWRFLYILGCLLTVTLALTPRAEAGFIGYYDPTNPGGNWMLINNPAGNGTAGTPDFGNTLVVTGSQPGSGDPTMTDFVIIAPAAGTVMFTFSYASTDTMFPLCGPDLTDACDDGGYLLNGSYTMLADALNQNSGPISFSVNAGDTFGFRVNAADNTGEPGSLTIGNFSAPAPLSVPEPGTAGMLAAAAVASLAVRRRVKQARQ
jgi:hypothetical protein